MLRYFCSRDRGSYFGLRGLRNNSLSCCVNAVLQTLSATEELCDLLEKWDTADDRLDRYNVPLNLKRVLVSMRSGGSTPDPHRDFLLSLDRNYLRLNTQHDADEVFLSILNLLQQQMNDKALAHQIHNLYRTSVETRLQCLECRSIRTRTSLLLTFPLHLKEENNSLEECLTSFFQHQDLSGANSWFCSPCGGHTASEQAVKVLALPPILCLQLKRFRSRRGSTFKLNCSVTFPQTFDFSETVKEAFSLDVAQNHCTYTLYAVVVHSGYAECGHYTAYVKLKEQWFYADDSQVQKSSWEKVQTSYGENHRGTAYMLMYRRCLKEEQRP
ncbi:ubl carboxyl-terminal hydrolase 18 [Gouania willdenowi]|uniref:USP domain-containing protein n=1 Tax=Gouania willdenowi TaxID=441366 RepID=A0A8C5E0R9_GOUWI|nr:ubl carboxyl-terminal hydrolase 18 [Gouania willdenowi]